MTTSARWRDSRHSNQDIARTFGNCTLGCHISGGINRAVQVLGHIQTHAGASNVVAHHLHKSRNYPELFVLNENPLKPVILDWNTRYYSKAYIRT